MKIEEKFRLELAILAEVAEATDRTLEDEIRAALHDRLDWRYHECVRTNNELGGKFRYVKAFFDNQ